MEWVPINFALMKNPINWFTVLLMVLLGSILLTYVDKQLFSLPN